MRRASFGLAVSMLALTALLARAPAGAEEPLASSADSHEAHITYLTESTVYVDAGAAQGIKEGDVLDVIRSGNVVARLRVFVASSHKAGCHREEAGAPLEIGDLVRYRAYPSSGPGAPAADATTGSSRPTVHKDFAQRLRDAGISGRIGLRYIMLIQPDSGLGYHQPGVDLRVDGRNIGGSGAGLDVDIRAYRSYRTIGSGSSSSDSSNRIYRANASWDLRRVPLHLVLGRQFSPSLATVSVFDGSLAEYVGNGFSIGALAGTQPDPVTYGFSTKTHEYGTYAELRNKVDASRRWGATLGLIGSYDNSHINREFVYLQGRYNDRITSLFVAQEIDVNRGWKRDQGESTLSSTSTFAFARVQAQEHISINAGIDNRRNVRLYRDLVNPLTEFEDQYRSGYWVGTDARFGWFLTGFDVRFARGGSAGSADAYSLNMGALRLTRLRLDLRERTTRYTSDQAEGWLHSLTAGLPLGDLVNVSLSGGVRDESSKLTNGPDTRLAWYGIDCDVALGRHWFYLLSLERNQGDNVGNYQLYTALSYRL